MITINSLEELEKDKIIPTGFKKFDYLSCGFRRKELICAVSQLDIGKTNLGLNFITKIALSHQTNDGEEFAPIHTAVFTMDQSSKQISDRMLSSMAKVDIDNISSGNLNSEESKRLSLSKTKLDMASIYIDDTPDMTLDYIINKCQELKQEKGLDIVMIDNFQLLSIGNQQDKNKITGDLKIAARKLNIVILITCQFFNNIKVIEDNRVSLYNLIKNLHEIGIDEFCADKIIILDKESNTIRLHIAKNRNGNFGTIEMAWDNKHMSFEELSIMQEIK